MEEQTARYPLKVLIVEDSADDAVFAIHALQAGRYEPFWKRVETASEMRQALLETKWELIIADHRLPRFSALEAFDIYRQFQLDIPFIIVSGVMSSYASSESAIALSTDVELELEIGRRHSLRPILQELLSNSMKYAFPDGTGKITIEFRRVAGEPRLRYRDSGPGLPRMSIFTTRRRWDCNW